MKHALLAVLQSTRRIPARPLPTNPNSNQIQNQIQLPSPNPSPSPNPNPNSNSNPSSSLNPKACLNSPPSRLFPAPLPTVPNCTPANNNQNPEREPNPTTTNTSPPPASSKSSSSSSTPSPTHSFINQAPLTESGALSKKASPRPSTHNSNSLTDPVDFAIRRLHFTPDPEQARILRAIVPRGILNCSRQWGKSTITALKAVHRAYLQPKALILVVSPSARQSALFIERAAAFLLELDIKRRGDTHHSLCLQLPNGSRIIGIPAVDATIRGFSSVSLLIIDEASRVPDNIYHTVRPMLATTGATTAHPAFPATPELWLISTPDGCRGFFHQEWHRSGVGDPKIDWQRFSISADKCPRIPPAFLKEEKNRLPEPLYQQEYFCQFIREGNNSLFRWRELQAALDPNVQPLFPNWSFPSWQHR